MPRKLARTPVFYAPQIEDKKAEFRHDSALCVMEKRDAYEL